MKQLFMVGPRRSEVREVPDLTPGKGEILVKVKYNGVCMSDWYPWSVAEPGLTLGHEPLGTVAGLGEGVEDFQVGDRITGLGKTPSLAEYCLIRQENALHIPDNLADEDAVVEPLSCIVSAASKLRTEKVGDTVAVVGNGYMGLGMISLLKLQGAGRIIAVDPRKQALENAERFGATELYTPDEVPDKYLVTEMDDTMWQRGVGIVSEFSGVESGLRLAGNMTAVHGTLGIGGWHQGGNRSIDFRLWGWKAITAINTHERRTAFQVRCGRNALDLLSRGIWNFKGVSKDIYGLNEFDHANEDMAAKPRNIIKCLIRCTD